MTPRHGRFMDAIRRCVMADLDGGMAEAEVARRYGVTRMTVRSWRSTA